jgi:putative endonuclease
MIYYTYIMSNFARTVFYIGVTNNIQTRVWQHRNKEGGLFTTKYKCHYLLYYEEYSNINDAISREKNLKNWKREWKINLILKENSELLDLAESWF